MISMQPMPKDYNFTEIEAKWQAKWEEMGIYHYDWNDKTRVPFSIDTPPPYPSGELHMGNVLNWTYFDMVARYKRMQGFNVLFPQGWDCHGLGIEIQVEKARNIRKRDVPPDQFRAWCIELVEKYIAMMKEGILKMGASIDWTTEYKTMNPDYWRRTQLSFILLHKKDYMYRGTHPVNWCPRDETAIADAEVDHIKKDGVLHYIRFQLEGSSEYLLIATSRPEFIPACVAVEVNPKDERYNKYIGRKISVPLMNREVTIIPEESVDPKFGTGVVQICTYGDKEDVKTVIKHKLPVIRLLTESGKISEAGCKYAGLYVNQARAAIVADLTAAGLLEKTEKIQQEVGVCDRCKAQVEILEVKQWFMKVLPLSDAVEQNARAIPWYPDYMRNRLIDWTRALDWDWVVSRQRLVCDSDSSLVLQELRRNHRCSRKLGANRPPNGETPNRASAPNVAEPNSRAKPTFWTPGWIPQSPVRSTRVGRTEQTGNTCSPQACILQAPTSSEPGHTTSWSATSHYSMSAPSTASS